MIDVLALAAIATMSPQAAVASLDPVSRQLLDAHNRERSLVAVPPLQWDASLAQAAIAYGPALAASGQLQHSPRASRPGQREAGTFPAVSATGNWVDVSHYTQMIWPTTTRVGCGVYRAPQWDYLICRYSPPGNVDGKRVP